MKPRLILMGGLPGSGKTTLARGLADEVPAVRLCERDEKRREARELGVDIELHYCDVPADELVRRLGKRNSAGDPNAFPVSREQVNSTSRSSGRQTKPSWPCSRERSSTAQGHDDRARPGTAGAAVPPILSALRGHPGRAGVAAGLAAG